MQQLEIQFFFPLTEQIPLALDYTECDKPKLWTTGTLLATNGAIGTTWANIEPNTFQFRPDPNCIGYWEVSKGIQVWREKRPNWLHRKYTELMLGWKWMDR